MYFARHAKSIFLLATVQLNLSSCDFFAESKIDPWTDHRDHLADTVHQVVENTKFYDANISAVSIFHGLKLVENR